MAARTASVAGVLLLLLILVVPSSSSYLAFRLQGSVHPHGDGYLYVTMKIGEPAREYNLDVDTGSVLTWLQCSNPYCTGLCTTWPQEHQLYQLKEEKKVPTIDPLCVELVKHPGNPNDKTCGYNIDYVSGSSQGYLIRDKFMLPITRNNAPQTIAFGCGFNQTDQHTKPGTKKLPVDGVLGLGKGSAVGLISQLKGKVIRKDAIAHCISSKGGGYLTVGNYGDSPRITWVPMDPNAKPGHYSPVLLAHLYFDSSQGPISDTPMKVTFDSGTTYTFFDRLPYQAAESAVIRSLDRSLRQAGPDDDLGLCWKGPRKFKSIEEVKQLFKSLSLVFGPRKVLRIPPENYLVISKKGYVCFAILRGWEHPLLGETNIIGGVTMQDRIIIYDNELAKIGWVDGLCRTQTESETTSRL
ncbi:hypothetical protein ACP70R_022503 [Stipagrostis hirtigluma subsp. patula]